ncbi:hypothetical protein V8D89_010016 [Ganoderma adspersum]
MSNLDSTRGLYLRVKTVQSVVFPILNFSDTLHKLEVLMHHAFRQRKSHMDFLLHSFVKCFDTQPDPGPEESRREHDAHANNMTPFVRLVWALDSSFLTLPYLPMGQWKSGTGAISRRIQTNFAGETRWSGAPTDAFSLQHNPAAGTDPAKRSSFMDHPSNHWGTNTKFLVDKDPTFPGFDLIVGQNLTDRVLMSSCVHSNGTGAPLMPRIDLVFPRAGNRSFRHLSLRFGTPALG